MWPAGSCQHRPGIAALQLACIAALALSFVQHVSAADEGADFSCEAIAKVPAEQRCSFIKEKCPSESLVPYAEWYFCRVALYNVVLRSAYVLAACCLLPLAFCLLGDTAEFYIAPIMAHVSQAIPKMRPRFAGVTFVALGNGAPDLSANIAAISAGEVVLSAGALTGAAMFVQCVVAAELMSLAGESGIKCGGAMLRDVGVYCVAIFSVLLAFALGQVTSVFVGWAVALYVLYMIWVFAGDEWHQRGRPKPDSQAFRDMLRRIASRGQVAAGPRGSSSGGGRPAGAAHGAGFSSRDELEDALLPWVVAEDEDEEGFARYTGDTADNAAAGAQGQAQYLPGRQHQQPLLAAIPSGRPPPEFEAQLPLSPSQGAGAGGLGAELGGLGSRPASITAQQRTTELSAYPASIRTSTAGRRVSAPTLEGTVAGMGGAGSSSDGYWSSPPAMHRPASATLPVNYQLRNGGSSSTASFLQWQHQQQRPGSSSARQSYVAQPHVLSLGNQSYIDPKTYKQLVWADLADDEEEEARLEREIARQLIGDAAAHSRAASSAAVAGGGSYQPPRISAEGAAGTSHQTGQQQQGPGLRSVTSLPTPLSEQYSIQQDQQQRQQPPPPSQAWPHLASPRADPGAFLSPFGSEAIRTGPNTPRSAGDGLLPTTLYPSGSSQFGPDKPGPAWGSGQHQVLRQGSAAVAAAEGLQLAQPQQQQQLAVGGDTWQQLQWQVTLGNSEEWVDAGPVRKLFRKVTFPLLLPAYLGQRLTIPFASASGYSREWLISSLLCCPLALIAYLGLITLPAVLIACGAGIVAAVLGAIFTAWDQPGQMAVQGLGGNAAAVLPGVLAVLAFIMGVVWIDTVASEVVGIITFLAGLASLPSGVMGLTLLAWGNSLGDFFGNKAMAKAGHTSTAITACFAAPLFNVLISLACGFSSYLHKLGSKSVKVQLTPEVALGCVFLIGYNAAIICVGRLYDGRLPHWFMYFARAWYGLYFVLAVASGFYNA